MNPIFEFLISPYENYQTLDIALEATAVILGLLSVYFAKRDQIAVYPSGMISTAIFVYLLFKANLLGDMLINAYFFLVSIYGWYFWQNKKKKKSENPISKMDPFERKWWRLFFILILFFVAGVYNFFDKGFSKRSCSTSDKYSFFVKHNFALSLLLIYHAVHPPSTNKLVPVVKDDDFDAK